MLKILIFFTLILFLSLPLAMAQEERSPLLVNYSFDDNNLTTGPDTFAIFQGVDIETHGTAKTTNGAVKLTSNYKFSGYRSIEIRDVAEDSTFPELQGYFLQRSNGKIFAHFAIMFTNTKDRLNLALAGPEWFVLKKGGIAFWLSTKDHALYQCTNKLHEKLFSPKCFLWYLVDVSYDIDAGTYDLNIQAENEKKPIIALKDQLNAAGKKGSAVDKFSFIGDLDDATNAIYYVDDITISADNPIQQSQFVAPGRRKLFIDSWYEYQKYWRQRPGYVPAIDFSDFGLTNFELSQLKHENLMPALEALINGKDVDFGKWKEISAVSEKFLKAIQLWQAGSAFLANNQAKRALNNFEMAKELVPSAKIYQLSILMALASLQRWTDVDAKIVELYPSWQNDGRFAAALAMIGIARGNLDEAEKELVIPAQMLANDYHNGILRRLWDGEIDSDLLDAVKREFPQQWIELVEERLFAEQYYFVLLWKGSFAAAQQYAMAMITRLEALKLNSWHWFEYAGDAAFLAGDQQSARQYYQNSLKRYPGNIYPLLKLSDLYFLAGDSENERIYREEIYGHLSSEN